MKATTTVEQKRRQQTNFFEDVVAVTYAEGSSKESTSGEKKAKATTSGWNIKLINKMKDEDKLSYRSLSGTVAKQTAKNATETLNLINTPLGPKEGKLVIIPSYVPSKFYTMGTINEAFKIARGYNPTEVAKSKPEEVWNAWESGSKNSGDFMKSDEEFPILVMGNFIDHDTSASLSTNTALVTTFKSSGVINFGTEVLARNSDGWRSIRLALAYLFVKKFGKTPDQIPGFIKSLEEKSEVLESNKKNIPIDSIPITLNQYSDIASAIRNNKKNIKWSDPSGNAVGTVSTTIPQASANALTKLVNELLQEENLKPLEPTVKARRINITAMPEGLPKISEGALKPSFVSLDGVTYGGKTIPKGYLIVTSSLKHDTGMIRGGRRAVQAALDTLRPGSSLNKATAEAIGKELVALSICKKSKACPKTTSQKGGRVGRKAATADDMTNEQLLEALGGK